MQTLIYSLVIEDLEQAAFGAGELVNWSEWLIGYPPGSHSLRQGIASAGRWWAQPFPLVALPRPVCIAPSSHNKALESHYGISPLLKRKSASSITRAKIQVQVQDRESWIIIHPALHTIKNVQSTKVDKWCEELSDSHLEWASYPINEWALQKKQTNKQLSGFSFAAEWMNI